MLYMFGVEVMLGPRMYRVQLGVKNIYYKVILVSKYFDTCKIK